jgi:hypothetical protein
LGSVAHHSPFFSECLLLIRRSTLHFRDTPPWRTILHFNHIEDMISIDKEVRPLM